MRSSARKLYIRAGRRYDSSPRLTQTSYKKDGYMINPIPAWSRRNLAAIIVAAAAVAGAACSGTGTNTPTGLPSIRNGDSSSVPYTWTFIPVNYTSGGNNSRVTGINNVSWIVGLNGTTHADYSSWTSEPPSTDYDYDSFKLRDYPTSSANGTYLSAVNNEAMTYAAGTEFAPLTTVPLKCTTCAITYDGYGSGIGYGSPGGCGSASPPTPCLWTLLQDTKEGTHSCAVTEGESVGDPEILVGYYETGASNCGTQAFEAYYSYATGETFVDFNVPGAQSNTTVATGTNNEGDTVGTAQFGGSAASPVSGWYYIDGEYCTDLQYPATKKVSTYPLAINWQDQIAGYYEGSDGIKHGFLLLNPKAPTTKQNWQEVTYHTGPSYYPPNNNTVVAGINETHAIAGWYTDSGGKYHGFVGTCNGGSKGCGDDSPTESQRLLAARRAVRDLLARRPETAQSGCSPSDGMRRKGR
jgi:hypothetical protein